MKNSLQSLFQKGTLALVAGLILSACSSTNTYQDQSTPVTIFARDPMVEYSGRFKQVGPSQVTFGYSGARVRLRFRGESIGMWMRDELDENYVMIWIDGEPTRKIQLDSDNDYYELASGLSPGEHTVEVVRVTECSFGLNTFRGFTISGPYAAALEWKHENDRKIEFIGDSITCGYGVEVNDPSLSFSAESENFGLSYSSLTARNLDADYLVVARSGIGMVRNHDGPFDGSENTMPELYPYTFYMRPDSGVWDYENFVPDVVCINLGTNDFSTSGVNVDKYVSTYVDFASMLLGRYPDTQLVVLQGPMDNSEELGAALDRVVAGLKEVAEDRVHFLELSPQGELGFGADYHPNVAQSKVNAAELTAFLSNLMNWD